MIEIKQISTYQLDTGEGVIIGSERHLPLEEEERRFLTHKLEKLFAANRRKEGTLPAMGWLNEQVYRFQRQEQSFTQLAEEIAQRYYTCKRECNRFAPSALVIAIVAYEQAHYLLLLDHGYRSAFHCTLDDHHHSVYQPTLFLSNTLLKDDFAFTLSMGDHSLYVLEQRGEKGYVMSEHFLQVQPVPSYDEAHQAMEESVRALTEKYEMDTTLALTKMKQVAKEHVEEQEELRMETIAQEVFEEVPFAADEFCARMKQAGIQESVALENVKVRKAMSMQRIKTDTGVEITFPIEYMEESDKLEIVHARDGMMLIAIKNVTHIQNR